MYKFIRRIRGFSLLFVCGVTWIVFFSGCGVRTEEKEIMSKEDLTSIASGSFEGVEGIKKLFPLNVADVKNRLDFAIDDAKKSLENLLSIKKEDRTFESTVRAYDLAESRFDVLGSGLHLAKNVHPEKSLRDACHDALIKMSGFAIDNFLTVDLYHVFLDYVDGNSKSENLTTEQRYFLDEQMKAFRRAGLHLSSDKLDRVKSLKKDLTSLSLAYMKNIAEDDSRVLFEESALSGLSKDFINSLERDSSGKCIVKCTPPNFDEIRKHCSNARVRKDFVLSYYNRAYPENKEVLENLISKRDELAHLLGFSSYADYDLDNQMAKTVNTAESFIFDLAKNVESKESAEYDRLVSDLHESVVLRDKKFEFWDVEFAKEFYKKKHFDVDDREVANYFPVKSTIQGIFDIYQKFLGLNFTLLKPEGLWHKDVSVIEVCRLGGGVEGYIFLDLYPRDGKYTHACCGSLFPAVAGGRPYVGYVLANFPKPSKDKPSLLKHSDVTTFFHEFGHAMHGLLGRTELFGFSGTNTKHDFVEVPSQMFEEWMWDKKMLRMVSSHYKTGESLPEKFIDKMVELKRFDYGYFIQRQCYLSLLSLAYYKSGVDKDLDVVEHDLYRSCIKHVFIDPAIHLNATFGHLTSYAAKYYCYMWSKFIALDFFHSKCSQGLLDDMVGGEFTDYILGLGGSVDPAVLAKNFLGRDPMIDPLLKDIGVKKFNSYERGVSMKKVFSFFGPPGTGKGTVAKRCVEELGYTTLSTGDLLRSHIQRGTEVGRAIQEYVDSGQLVPDDLITRMVIDWLKEQPSEKIIVDGFPRTKPQADLFLQALKKDDAFKDVEFEVVNFELSEEDIIKRISNRLVCSNKECGALYSATVKKPAKAGVCDKCDSPLIRRKDDDESVARERLKIFAKHANELIGFYKASGSKVINFVIPSGPPEVVFDAFNHIVK